MSEKQVVFSLSLCLFSLLLLFRLPFLLDDIVKAKNKAEVASIPNEKSEEKKYLDVKRWTICFVMRFRFSVDRDPVRFHHFSSIRTFGFLISIEMQWIAHRNERMMLLFIFFQFQKTIVCLCSYCLIPAKRGDIIYAHHNEWSVGSRQNET